VCCGVCGGPGGFFWCLWGLSFFFCPPRWEGVVGVLPQVYPLPPDFPKQVFFQLGGGRPTLFGGFWWVCGPPRGGNTVGSVWGFGRFVFFLWEVRGEDLLFGFLVEGLNVLVGGEWVSWFFRLGFPTSGVCEYFFFFFPFFFCTLLLFLGNDLVF